MKQKSHKVVCDSCISVRVSFTQKVWELLVGLLFKAKTKHNSLLKRREIYLNVTEIQLTMLGEIALH